MKKEIIISSAVRNGMEQHAMDTFPNECCGFLFGSEKGERMIDEFLPVENAKQGDQRRRFEISPVHYLKAEKHAIQNGKDFLGIYHSHPNHPAIASEHDLAQAMPYFSYVIISIMEGVPDDIKSWVLKDEERLFTEEIVITRKP